MLAKSSSISIPDFSYILVNSRHSQNLVHTLTAEKGVGVEAQKCVRRMNHVRASDRTSIATERDEKP